MQALLMLGCFAFIAKAEKILVARNGVFFASHAHAVFYSVFYTFFIYLYYKVVLRQIHDAIATDS